MRIWKLIAIAFLFLAGVFALMLQPSGGPVVQKVYASDDGRLDDALAAVLADAGFTGNIQQIFQQRLEANLGRPIDPKLANLGRLLWFDMIHSLHHDNTCGGCHSPTNGFGDSQPMAIGVQNNNLVGPDRAGPRNQRRTPLVINTALYPALMWNGRFNSRSGDPFDNSQGFRFPFPEADARVSSANNLAHGLTAFRSRRLGPGPWSATTGWWGRCRCRMLQPAHWLNRLGRRRSSCST